MKTALIFGLLASLMMGVLGAGGFGPPNAAGNEWLQQREPRRKLIMVRVLAQTPEVDEHEVPEPWISETLQFQWNVFGPVKASPWIPLAAAKQRIFTSEQGDIELDASVVYEFKGGRMGVYVVNFEGHEEVEIKKSALLRSPRWVIPISKPGEADSLYVAIAGDEGKESPIPIQLTGTLRTGNFAIGGETTGTVLSTTSGDFELDLAENQELQRQIETWDGKPVQVVGSFERRAGVEIRERWIVKPSKIKLQE